MASEDYILTRELVKRIFGNLGAVPGKNFGKVGITLDEFKLSKTISLKEDDSKTTTDHSIWAAEVKIDIIYKAIITNIGTIDIPEFVMLLKVSGINMLGFRLLWDEEDSGVIMSYDNDEWRPISVLRKLQLTAAIELMTQQGVVWYPCQEVDDLYDQFVALVDFA